MLYTLMDIFPTPPNGTPSEVFRDNIDFFSKWISRIGGIVAFIGAVKLAISVKSDDAKEQFTALMTMVAGFMIVSAVNNMTIFNIPSSYTDQAAEKEFQSIMTFVGRWTRRVGAAVLFFGAASLMFSIKEESAGAKALASRTITAGAVIVGISAMLAFFV